MSESKTKFQPTSQQYTEWLKRRGYWQIGSGAYSTVFAHPKHDNVAVKVNRAADSWPDYVSWATQNGYAGNFAPKVHSLKNYDYFYVATMERLPATLNQLRAGILPDGQRTTLEEQADIVTGSYSSKDNNRGHKALRKFATALHKAGFNHDLHGSNIMVRKNNKIVVTDPAGEDLKASTRIKRGVVTVP